MEFLIVVVVIMAIILLSCINVVPQARAYVIERLGGYQGTWGVGIHFKIPFIDRVARKVDLKEQVADFPPQPVITKDNVTMRIDTVIFYQITDPKLYSLQYLLQSIMENINQLRQNPQMGSMISKEGIPAETVRMAMAVVVAGPALIVFPFFQKYFVKGLTVGSVKG